MSAEALISQKACNLCNSTDISLYDLKKNYFFCKSCSSSRRKEKYLKNRATYIEQAAGRYKEKEKAYGTKHWATVTRAGLRHFDRKKNKYPICDISNDDLFAIIKNPCVYCGDSVSRIGVDRVDNEIGHIKTNLVPSCYSCNSIRMEKWTHEEMKILGKAIAEIKARRRST